MRPNLSSAVAERIRDRIAAGRMPSGQRINETELSRELDVSRTPLREALSRLASEGFVSVRPRRGFYVQSLDPEEVRDLYQVRAILDPAALEMAGLVDPGRLQRLRDINEGIRRAAGDPDALVERDDEWHLALLARCPNGIVLGLIRQFMLRTRPLEREYLSEHANVETMVREHEEIVMSLAEGDLPAAVAGLRANMTSAIPVLMEWVRGRGDE